MDGASDAAIAKARKADRSRQRAPARDFRMPGAPFTWTNAGLELEIGFRDFEPLVAPFSLLGNVPNLPGRSDLLPGRMPNTGRERDSLMTAETSLIARFNSL